MCGKGGSGEGGRGVEEVSFLFFSSDELREERIL